MIAYNYSVVKPFRKLFLLFCKKVLTNRKQCAIIHLSPKQGHERRIADDKYVKIKREDCGKRIYNFLVGSRNAYFAPDAKKSNQ